MLVYNVYNGCHTAKLVLVLSTVVVLLLVVAPVLVEHLCRLNRNRNSREVIDIFGW